MAHIPKNRAKNMHMFMAGNCKAAASEKKIHKDRVAGRVKGEFSHSIVVVIYKKEKWILNAYITTLLGVTNNFKGNLDVN